MERKIYGELLKWKADKKGVCLTVKGQRQVGKTYIIEKFASENYPHFVKIDFNKDPEFKAVFEGSLSVDSIINGLALRIGSDSLVPGSTLIFLDEIQDCKRAHSSLKEFALDGRYDVIASGSLMGITNHNSKERRGSGSEIEPISPMGYERVITMRSMDFEEFLWARGFSKDILEGIKSKIRSKEPLTDSELQVLSRHFRDFMIVGGMPAAVRDFADTGSYADAGADLDIILGDTINDINRYNSAIDARKTQRCFQSIPEQLASSNKKFHYSRIESEYQSHASREKYATNLLWIEQAGYGNFCYALEAPQLPFKTIPDSFKVYTSDTGMLVRMMGRATALAIHEWDTGHNLGGVTENEVAECIAKSGYRLRFYRKSSGKNQMEIDFVIDMMDECVAVEVKSGKDKSSSSISKVGSVFKVDRRIQFEDGNIFVDEDGMEHYPLFAAAFIRLMEREHRGPEFRRPRSLDTGGTGRIASRCLQRVEKEAKGPGPLVCIIRLRRWTGS